MGHVLVAADEARAGSAPEHGALYAADLVRKLFVTLGGVATAAAGLSQIQVPLPQHVVHEGTEVKDRWARETYARQVPTPLLVPTGFSPLR